MSTSIENRASHIRDGPPTAVRHGVERTSPPRDTHATSTRPPRSPLSTPIAQPLPINRGQPLAEAKLNSTGEPPAASPPQRSTSLPWNAEVYDPLDDPILTSACFSDEVPQRAPTPVSCFSSPAAGDAPPFAQKLSPEDQLQQQQQDHALLSLLGLHDEQQVHSHINPQLLSSEDDVVMRTFTQGGHTIWSPVSPGLLGPTTPAADAKLPALPASSYSPATASGSSPLMSLGTELIDCFGSSPAGGRGSSSSHDNLAAMASVEESMAALWAHSNLLSQLQQQSMSSADAMGSLNSSMQANMRALLQQHMQQQQLQSSGGSRPAAAMQLQMPSPDAGFTNYSTLLASLPPADALAALKLMQGAAVSVPGADAIAAIAAARGGIADGLSPAQRAGNGWDDLEPSIRDKVLAVADSCGPYVKVHHFDAGVRHWLVQISSQFGEHEALAGLQAIASATNLQGVRNMKAFITTRLIDHYEQLIWAQDPQSYAMCRLTPEQHLMIQQLVQGEQGLSWNHFDPKVLETIRNMGNTEYTQSRLMRLTAKELAHVKNVPAYLYTLLSKRGKTARQAAAAKAAAELALSIACHPSATNTGSCTLPTNPLLAAAGLSSEQAQLFAGLSDFGEQGMQPGFDLGRLCQVQSDPMQQQQQQQQRMMNQAAPAVYFSPLDLHRFAMGNSAMEAAKVGAPSLGRYSGGHGGSSGQATWPGNQPGSTAGQQYMNGSPGMANSISRSSMDMQQQQQQVQARAYNCSPNAAALSLMQELGMQANSSTAAQYMQQSMSTAQRSSSGFAGLQAVSPQPAAYRQQQGMPAAGARQQAGRQPGRHAQAEMCGAAPKPLESLTDRVRAMLDRVPRAGLPNSGR